MAAAVDVDVIDLISPPPSPRRGDGAADLIDLCDSEDEMDVTPRENVPPQDPHQPAATKRPAGPADATVPPEVKVQRTASAHSASSSSAGLRNSAAAAPSDDDNDVLETAAPAAPVLRAAAVAGGDADDDLEFVGRTGANALSDFPHARENCVSFPFVQGSEHKQCENCYCYVCDAPASGCTEWADHCRASHSSAAWQQRRLQWRNRSRAAAAPAAGSSGAGEASARRLASGASPPPLASAPPRRADTKIVRWSCDKYYREVQQIYPVEEKEPAGLLSSITLRPYQKQSLAFMLALERSKDPKTAGQASFRDSDLHGVYEVAMHRALSMYLWMAYSVLPEPLTATVDPSTSRTATVSTSRTATVDPRCAAAGCAMRWGWARRHA
jgi:hypothetical protein